MANELPRFGANDFYLTEYDPLVIREKLRAALSDVLGRDVQDSDPHMVVASAFMPFLVQGLASIDACAKATLRAFAVGADLDRIADSTCVVSYLNRKSAAASILPCLVQCKVTRSDTLAPSDVSISWSTSRDAQGVEFSGSGSFIIHFGLSEGLSKVLNFPIYLRCSETGAAFNAMFDDVDVIAQDSALTTNAVIEADEAPTTATGQTFEVSEVSIAIAGETYAGMSIEGDDDFAVRASWQAKATRVPGSLEYFKLELSKLSLLPSAYIAPSLDGQGRIVLAWSDKPSYLASKAGITLDYKGDAYHEFLKAVQGSLLVEQHAYAYQAGVFDPSALFSVSYKLPANVVDVPAACSRVLSAYKAWRSSVAWHCGAAVRASDITAVIIGAGGVEVSVDVGSIPDEPLPADRIILASQFELNYLGLAMQATPAEGGAGEDITPV